MSTTKEERLLELRAYLEFIRKSKIPKNPKDQKHHELIVAKAHAYLNELDIVENILDAEDIDCYYTIENAQFDDLMSQQSMDQQLKNQQHDSVFCHFYHFGKYLKLAELRVDQKFHCYLGYTPIAHF